MNRKGFIGGSDCVKIMQGDWLELWQVKTGRIEPADLSEVLPVQLGIWTEEFNLKWFEQEYKCTLHHRQHQIEQEIGGIPAKGTVDAMFSGNVVEAKHTNAFSNMDEQLERYMPQIQLYCHLADVEGAYLSVIFGNSKWESVYVRYNEDYFNSMWAVVSDFWGYVVRGQEPIDISTPSLSIEKIEIDNMVVRDASKDNAFVNEAHIYVENKAAASAFESAKSNLKNMVGKEEREVYCDLLAIKRAKNGSLRFTVRK